jgi:hypothetical protein
MKTIATFMTSHDAHMLRIRLESAGIPAQVSDDTTASIAPHLANAIGGVRVQVPEEAFVEAKEFLGHETTEDEVDLREELVCPKCGSQNIAQALHEKRSWFISFLMLILAGLYLPLVKKQYQCNDCNHLWK